MILTWSWIILSAINITDIINLVMNCSVVYKYYNWFWPDHELFCQLYILQMILTWSRTVLSAIDITDHIDLLMNCSVNYNYYRLLILYCEIIVGPSYSVDVAKLSRLRSPKNDVQRWFHSAGSITFSLHTFILWIILFYTFDFLLLLHLTCITKIKLTYSFIRACFVCTE